MTTILRLLWMLLAHDWHPHVCTCGATWLCTAKGCSRDAVCVDCDTRQMADWFEDYAHREQDRKGAA